MIASRSVQALIFLVNTLLGLYTAAILLRFLLQWRRADFYNPFAQAVMKITNPLLLPLRRVVPPWQRLDTAAVALAFLVQFVNVLLVMWISELPYTGGYLVFWTVMKLVFVLVNLYFFTILMEAVMSWLGQARYNPLSGVLTPLNAPLLRPARQLLPPISGLDFSPLLVMLLLQVVNMLLPLQWPLI